MGLIMTYFWQNPTGSAWRDGPLPLDEIKVLYRASDTLDLWGIPYQMRRGQSPRHLKRGQREFYEKLNFGKYGFSQGKGPDLSDWIWLGSPGWYGSMKPDEIAQVKAFLQEYKDLLPSGPEEWIDLVEEGRAPKPGPGKRWEGQER